MKYLIEKYAKDDSLYPKDPQERAIAEARLYFDSGVLWPKVYGYGNMVRFLKNSFQKASFLYF